VGIPIGIAVAPPAPDVPNAIDDLIARSRAIAATGVASLWLGQLFDIDAITALGVIGRDVPDVELGTAVATTYPRHPVVMSSQAQTTQCAIADGFGSGSAYLIAKSSKRALAIPSSGLLGISVSISRYSPHSSTTVRSTSEVDDRG